MATPRKTATKTVTKKTPAKRTTRRKTTPKPAVPVTVQTVPEPQDWIRNLHQVPLALRFDSQKQQGSRRTELKPRGSRGDTIKVKPEDIDTHFYQSNIGLGFEALTATEAKEVISKQSINIQAPVHPVMATLRNALDQPYEEGAVQVDPGPEDIVAGSLEGVRYDESGAPIDQSFKRAEIRRGGASPIIDSTVPGSIQPEAGSTREQRDAIARNKSIEGPKAGLAGLKVTVAEPTTDPQLGL